MSGERGEAEVEELEDVGGEWLSEIGEDVARLLLLVVIFFAIFVPPSFCFRLEGNAEVFVHFAKNVSLRPSAHIGFLLAFPFDKLSRSLYEKPN